MKIKVDSSKFEKCKKRDTRQTLTSKIVFGFLVIITGILLLGFNTGILPLAYKPVLFSWPMLLIIIGIIQLSHRFFGGIILILIGGFFIIPKLEFVNPFFVNMYWPVLIIVGGLLIILKSIIGSKNRHIFEQTSGFTSSEIKNGIIDENNIFSGSKRQFQDEVFRGGEINCIFGGSEIDLSRAELGEGVNYLEINCIFGGVNIVVPSEWVVQVKKNSIFGDFQDKRKSPVIQKPNNNILHIEASCIFGGGEIRSY